MDSFEDMQLVQLGMNANLLSNKIIALKRFGKTVKELKQNGLDLSDPKKSELFLIQAGLTEEEANRVQRAYDLAFVTHILEEKSRKKQQGSLEKRVRKDYMGQGTAITLAKGLEIDFSEDYKNRKIGEVINDLDLTQRLIKWGVTFGDFEERTGISLREIDRSVLGLRKYLGLNPEGMLRLYQAISSSDINVKKKEPSEVNTKPLSDDKIREALVKIEKKRKEKISTPKRRIYTEPRLTLPDINIRISKSNLDSPFYLLTEEELRRFEFNDHSLNPVFAIGMHKNDIEFALIDSVRSEGRVIHSDKSNSTVYIISEEDNPDSFFTFKRKDIISDPPLINSADFEKRLRRIKVSSLTITPEDLSKTYFQEICGTKLRVYSPEDSHGLLSVMGSSIMYMYNESTTHVELKLAKLSQSPIERGQGVSKLTPHQASSIAKQIIYFHTNPIVD